MLKLGWCRNPSGQRSASSEVVNTRTLQCACATTFAILEKSRGGRIPAPIPDPAAALHPTLIRYQVLADPAIILACHLGRLGVLSLKTALALPRPAHSVQT